MPKSDDAPAWVSGVLAFWFDELEPKDWFVKSAETDARIVSRFADVHRQVTDATPESLMGDARTALAAIIVLDQFSRNMFRDAPAAFASDAKALGLAKAAVGAGFDRQVARGERVFFYMPFEHSEVAGDQDTAVAFIAALGDDDFTYYAHAHRQVIARYGRFPHRNAILGRESTPEELAYLAEPGSGF